MYVYIETFVMFLFRNKKKIEKIEKNKINQIKYWAFKVLNMNNFKTTKNEMCKHTQSIFIYQVIE